MPPTIPRRQVKIVAERRTVSARASSTQGRTSSTDRPMTGAPPLGAHESAEVEGVGVQGEMPNPSNPFGPWGEPSQTDLGGGDLAMVVAKVKTVAHLRGTSRIADDLFADGADSLA